MAKQQTVISLDPIDRGKRREKGFLGRLLITRWGKGKKIEKMEPYGHYMFCGKQGSGKTSSALWYAEFLAKKYKKKRIKYTDHTECDEDHLFPKCKFKKFKKPPKIYLYSNIDIGKHIDKYKIFETIDGFDEYANEIRIVYIDEIHTYFPKGAVNKDTKEMQEKLTAIFSQLRKRNTFVLSTAQVYGRLEKALREQCLYMIDCKVNFRNKLVNEFIEEGDILCDDLGRWSGDPKMIYVHGLPVRSYDTKKIIRN